MPSSIPRDMARRIGLKNLVSTLQTSLLILCAVVTIDTIQLFLHGSFVAGQPLFRV